MIIITIFGVRRSNICNADDALATITESKKTVVKSASDEKKQPGRRTIAMLDILCCRTILLESMKSFLP